MSEGNFDRCKYHGEELEKIKHILYGNGREGIVTKVNRIEWTLKAIVALITPGFVVASGIIVNWVFNNIFD